MSDIIYGRSLYGFDLVQTLGLLEVLIDNSKQILNMPITEKKISRKDTPFTFQTRKYWHHYISHCQLSRLLNPNWHEL